MLSFENELWEQLNEEEKDILEALEIGDYDKGVDYLLKRKKAYTKKFDYNSKDVDVIIDNYKTAWKKTGNFVNGLNWSFSPKDFNKDMKSFNTYLSNVIPQLNSVKQFTTDYNIILEIQSAGGVSWRNAVKTFQKKYPVLNVKFSDGSPYPAKAYFKMLVQNFQKGVTQNTANNLASQIGTDVFQYGTSNGPNKRESCAKLELELFAFGRSGTIKDLNGKTQKFVNINSYGFGEADGPQGINCEHNYFPVKAGSFKL